ncbi:F-box/WD repeat-containing protein 9-like isoform X2 [Lineus longissimus]
MNMEDDHEPSSPTCDDVLSSDRNQNAMQDCVGNELRSNICDQDEKDGDKSVTKDGGILSPTFHLSPKHQNRPNEISLKRCLSDQDADGKSILPVLLLPEIFLKICSYLPAKFVLGTLTRVCRQFHDLLSDDATWKIRTSKQGVKRYPVVPVENFNWKKACVMREEQLWLWSNPDQTMDHFMLSDGISAPVDAVHLMSGGSLLASGSRDKYLNLWDLDKIDVNEPSSKKDARIVSKMNAHNGWIWSITSHNHIMATASWDTYIKFWDLGAGVTEIRSVKCKSAVLATKYTKDVLVAGSYDKYISVIDPRVATIVSRIRHHRMPVLSIEADDNYIISGSEDKTVCIYDRRAEILLKTLHFEHFPMCMDYNMNQLFIGDKIGRLHLVDASDVKFDLIKTYDPGHVGKLTGVLYNYGSIMSCSTDRTVRIMEPCLNPGNIHTIKSHDAEVAKISWQNSVLATAGSDMLVGIWRPKSQHQHHLMFEEMEENDS